MRGPAGGGTVTLVACVSADAGPLSSEPIRVLVVDDHASFREMLTDFLAAQDGIDVVGECGDGSEVPSAVDRLRPDVVLMDLSMPVVDGEQATRVLRATRPDVVVVVLTAEGAAAVERARTAGAHALVPKDADPELLVRCVRSLAHAGADCPFAL
ncbi:response regulator [Trujillonella humicola]|uniref:response regulator n=1 Tax=Trujillonella humicola TaxID=3383699 RepID=UPI003905ABCE